MAKYLKKFESHTQYDNYINGSGAILPNVSICTTEGDVHYNPSTPPTPVETRVVAKFNVEDTSEPIQILSTEDDVSSIEIDGVEQPSVVTEYTFSTIGEHTVKYTLSDPTTIGEGAFANCYNLTSIDIPDSVTSIGTQAFNDCGNLTSCTIGSGVTTIGYMAFQGCSSLTSIDIPNSVTTIGDSAFASCYNLTSCTIGSGVTSIGSQAFAFCSSLTSIVIPSSITHLGSYIFDEVYIRTITILATTPPTQDGGAFGGMCDHTIYVPSESVEAYKTAEDWEEYAHEIYPIE